MLQRYERRDVDQELIRARNELSADYEMIQQLNYQQLTSSDSAELLLSMINKLSVPTIGTQVLRTDLTQIEFPFLAEYEAIMDKAEVYYYQSIVQDLNRIKNNEAIIQISKEEICQCVEQLNWKINVQRSSRLNESQEVGENMDLMKFFEGVRNYQNWHENIKRETFTRLKERSHAIENELSFKKGFILSKLERKLDEIQKANYAEMFKINHQYVRFERIMHIMHKLRQCRKKQYFDFLFMKCKETSITQKLYQMFTRYLPRKFVGDLRKLSIDLKMRKQRVQKITSKVANLKKNLEFVFKHAALKKLTISPMLKASKYTLAVKHITHVCQKYYVKTMIKSFHLPPKAIFYILNQKYLTQMNEAFNELKENDVEIRLERPNVSYRIKGKILASLNKYQKEGINLKQTFSKWYLNTHEQKYAKKVYNIWLQGNTNKFTFFMRLKNLVDQMSKHKISKELKNFVKVACEKYHKYEEYNKKNYLTRWIEKNRRLRKIQEMFKLLTNITNETHSHFKKLGNEKIAEYCKRKQAIKHYCNMYMLQHIQNVKIALMKWRTINNIKKEWGRKKLRMILLRNTEQYIKTKKDALQVFKQNWRKGREIKTNITRKAINKDLIFLQRFMQFWRRNNNSSKAEIELSEKQVKANKTASIIGISNAFKRVQVFQVREVIKKFAAKRIQRIRRENNLKTNFINLIESNERYLKQQTFDIFSNNLKMGKQMKDRLVSKLVCANVVKEKLGLLIFRNKAFEMSELLKREKSTKIFDILQNKVKQNYLIFNRRLFLARILQKIVYNHQDNINTAFKCWKAMPMRMRWKLRSKIVKLQEQLAFMMKQRLSACNQAFKSCVLSGKLKQKKAVYIMACKYEMILKKYFAIYHKNTMIQREDDKLVYVTKLFETMAQQQKANFKPVYQSAPQWPMKAANIDKMNEYVKRRLQDYLHAWHKNTKALGYFATIKDEKKKRCLQMFAKVMIGFQNRNAKDSITSFRKNYNLRKRKMNILKKMCDSQVIKISKSFGAWKNLPPVTNKLKVERAARFESNLTRLVNRNIKIPINCMKKCLQEGRQKRLQLARSLVSNIAGRMKTLYNKWRQNKNLKIVIDKQIKVEKVFKSIFDTMQPGYQMLVIGDEASKKTKGLNIIENYWIKQQKMLIKRWYKNITNMKMKDLSKKYFLSNLNKIKIKIQNKQIIEKVIDKFKINRESRFKQKHRARCVAISKMIDKYQSQKRTLLNLTVDKLKFLQIKGNFHKNRSFHRFLTEKIKHVHRCLETWNQLAQQAKEIHKQKMISENFDHAHEIIKMNFYLIFARSRETNIKKNALDRLFKSTELKRKGCFDLWRQNAQALKMMGEMDKQTKATILERINKIVQSTSTQSVMAAIKKFNLNYKIQKIQRKFIEKLLQTKSGKVINAFKNWKAIPVANAFGKYKNYQKFYFKIQAFYNDRLRFAHNVFAETGQDGNLMKKQSILKLFEMTSLGIRRYYNRWTRLTKQKHILMTVNRALRAFESGQAAIANQYMILFQDQRAYKIKTAAIEKLIAASQGTVSNYFHKWRQNIKQAKILQSMDTEKKKMALSIFNKVMGSSKTGQVIQIIELFQKNSKVVKVARKFFNRLMHTKAGKVMSFFEKLKTIPDAKMNKLKKKGIIFESRLHNFVHKRLRSVLVPFKENNYTAQTKMKYCIERLIRACMGQNHKKFLLWRNINREAKMLVHTSLFEKAFNNMENIYKGNFQIAIKDSGAEIQKKKNLCRKLLNNSLFVQHHAYMIWKEAYHVDDINTKARQQHYTNHLKSLIGVFNSHENKRTIQMIGVFRKLLEMRNFQEYDFYKNYKNKRCLNFHSNLKKIEHNYKNVFINALKTCQAEFILAQKTKRLHSVFQAMQATAKTNMGEIFRTQSQTALLNKSFERLCNNKMMNVSKIFNIWRQNKKALDFKTDAKNEKKRLMLKLLNQLLIKKLNNKTVEALHKFSKNAKVASIKKRLCVRMLKTKTDKIPTLFNAWKNLPYQQAKKLKNKATKFERGLLNLMKNYLRQVNDCFKRCHYDGVTKKEEAVRKLVRSKLIDTNNLFFRWRKYNNESKITGKILTLDKTFTHLSTVFRDNFAIYDDCKRQDQRKIRGATSLFFNNVKRLNGYFNIWRKNSRIMKLHEFQRLMRNFNPEDFNQRLVRIGFLMISKRHEMEILKGYINSLWKWKLSNIQASYYTKFINVFKESEEMIKLSNLINKKIYENTHHAFRNILSVGHARTNRKREIVQKYLTRKARNYFLIFKNNTLKSEINIWKSKYTESIKFKIFSDVLTSIFLRTKSFAFATLANYHNFTNKIDSLKNIVERCQAIKLKAALDKIRLDAPAKVLQRSDKIYENIRIATLQQAFDALNYNRKVHRLNNVASIINKNQKFIAFSRINRYRQRVIKAKLSINLLQTLLRQKNVDKIKFAINQFSKKRVKRLGVEKIFKYAHGKYEDYARTLLDGCKNIQNIAKLLQRFRRGQMLQKILEKQDELLKKTYLNKMRKKENKWMELAIKKFATRASIRSSPTAITFWRLKTYALNI